MTEVDWASLDEMSGDALKAGTFRALQTISLSIQDEDEDEPAVQASVPRLAALIDRNDELASFRPVLATLARAVGLWNYIEPETSEPRDLVLAESAAVDLGRRIVLHREQIEALNILLAGRNLILSAPTSFGKSLIIDVLLATGRYRRVAIILPTIALLDEFRKRLVARFGSHFKVVMHHSEVAEEDEAVIFLGTQERLITREDVGYLDLLVVDEFYKLDPRRKDDRSMTLNAAVYRLIRRSKQFFFLGPNIEDVQISDGGKWKFEFLKTRFSTVAIDTIDLRKSPDRIASLKEEVFKNENWPALVFVSGPDAAATLARKLAESAPAASAEAVELAIWLKENFGSAWTLTDSIQAGIGLHHGRVPRSVASMMVRLFNGERRSLPILLCTSTLIEGVNTAAKSVMIYDKVIDRKSYDFFTFSNIRGRAGRLGEHLVGRVFLFHAPPTGGQIDVAPAIFQDLDDAPAELLVHLEPEEQTPKSTNRMIDIARSMGLPIQDVRRLSSVGFDNLGVIRDKVAQIIASKPHLLIWTGFPDYDQLKNITDIVCSVKHPSSFGIGSSAQMARHLGRLRDLKSFKAFFDEYAISQVGYEKYYEGIFKFLRSCEYTIPEYITAVERFARSGLPGFALRVDYSLFASEVSRWFQPDAVKGLEEQGVPIQISERFYVKDDSILALTRRLQAAAEIADPRLTRLERDWVLGALPVPRVET